ncbi:MAG TPA: T9SS type A sorting domain-containing protein [Chitinophagaceae bacterium]
MKFYPLNILSTLAILAGLCIPEPGMAQNISGVVNTYHKVTAINTTTNTVTLTSAAGLTPGVKVLVIQMKGATIDNSNSASFGNITAIGDAGNYEFNYVCSVNGNEVILVYSLLRSYTVSGMVQLVTVPRYASATVVDTVKASAWDPVSGTGGVVAIEATSLTLNAPIDASGMGFKGGVYVDHPQPPYNCDFATNITAYGFANPASGFQTGGTKGEGIVIANASFGYGRGKYANGGGGSNNHNAGGAGGSNAGAGGSGGQRSNEGAFNCHGTNPGIGGLSLSSNGYSVANNRVFLGGGGGAGHGNNNVGMSGGDGGGIVFIKAETLYGNNQHILANGARPYRAALTALIGDPYTAGGDGGGGGGGGGVIIYDVTTLQNFDVLMFANGANGSNSSYTPSSGCFGPGGGGGGGVIWTRNAAFIPQEQVNNAGGTNGVVSVTTSVVACRGLANGATSGGAGSLAFNYVPPASTALVCAPLPLNGLLYFEGKEVSEGIELKWKMRSITGIKSYVIERSVDKVSFTALANVNSNGQYNYSYIDRDIPAPYLYYRLKAVYSDGSSSFSQIIMVGSINKSELLLLRISPNPASNNLGLVIKSDHQGEAELAVYSRTSQKLISTKSILRSGINKVSLNVQSLPEGLYFVLIEKDGKKIVQSFVKSAR